MSKSASIKVSMTSCDELSVLHLNGKCPQLLLGMILGVQHCKKMCLSVLMCLKMCFMPKGSGYSCSTISKTGRLYVWQVLLSSADHCSYKRFIICSLSLTFSFNMSIFKILTTALTKVGLPIKLILIRFMRRKTSGHHARQ